jgi:hypothetical protein
MSRFATVNTKSAGHARLSGRALAAALLASVLVGAAGISTASASSQPNVEHSRCLSSGAKVCINVWVGPTLGSTIYVAQVEGTVTNLTSSQIYGDYYLSQTNNGGWHYWITGSPNWQDPGLQMYNLPAHQTLSYLTADWAYKPNGTCFVTEWTGPNSFGNTLAISMQLGGSWGSC